MKTIVSLALAGLMSISALLPALAAQEAASASIPESSGISESVAQDESGVSSSGSTAYESSAPESGSNAEDESDSVPQPESDSMPVESDGSTSDGSEAETSSSLPVSDSMVSDEMDADEAEDSSGVTAATADKQTIPVTVSEEYAILLATNQADSMMGHAGMERSDACTQPAASFALADYAAETEDESYCLLWEAMNAEFEQLGAQGYPAARCVYADDTLMVYV